MDDPASNVIHCRVSSQSMSSSEFCCFLRGAHQQHVSLSSTVSTVTLFSAGARGFMCFWLTFQETFTLFSANVPVHLNLLDAVKTLVTSAPCNICCSCTYFSRSMPKTVGETSAAGGGRGLQCAVIRAESSSSLRLGLVAEHPRTQHKLSGQNVSSQINLCGE